MANGKKTDGFISECAAFTPVIVVPTNEELVIAKETLKFLGYNKNV